MCWPVVICGFWKGLPDSDLDMWLKNVPFGSPSNSTWEGSWLETLAVVDGLAWVTVWVFLSLFILLLAFSVLLELLSQSYQSINSGDSLSELTG